MAGAVCLLVGVYSCGGHSQSDAHGHGGTESFVGGAAAAGDGHSNDGGRDGVPGGGETGGGSAESCDVSRDCSPNPCPMCRDSELCPTGECQGGQCFYPDCAQLECLGKACGAECSSCFDPDGSCVPGSCDRFGDCKPALDDCSPGVPRSCVATDAAGAGFSDGHTCNFFQGWGWDGAKCVAVVGCVCQGSDCRALLGDQSGCELTYRHCK